MPEAMYVRRVPLTDLHEDAGNCREHPPRSIEVLRGMLLQFGQIEPLVVQKGTGKIIGGNGRIQAMRELGWQHCDVVEVDLNDVQASALSIGLNRSTEHSSFNLASLTQSVIALKSSGFDNLPVLGFDDADLAKILQGVDWRAPGMAGAGPTGGEAEFGNVNEVPAPEISSGDRAPFQQMTFVLHDSQAESVKAAIKKAIDAGASSSVNENSNGNALATICKRYIEQN